MTPNFLSDTLWSQISLDQHLKITKTSNFDRRLFFGQNPVEGQFISEGIEKKHPIQCQIIMDTIDRSKREKRHACFIFHSMGFDTNSVYVSAHIEYHADESITLYLAPIHQEDLCGVQKSFEQEKQVVIQTIFEVLPIGVGVYACNGAMLYCNNAFRSILDLEKSCFPESLTSIDNCSFFPEELKTGIREGIAVSTIFPLQITSAGQPDSTHPTIRQIECSGQPILHSDGTIENYIFILTDVTNKLFIEETLQQNRLKTEIAMQSADIMFWEFDVATRLFYSDNEPMNGNNPSNPLTIEQYLNTIAPNDRTMALRVMHRMLKGEDFSFNFDMNGILPDVHYVFFSVNGAPFEKDENGIVTKYVGTRKNDTKLQKQKQLQNKILNNIPVSILIKDIDDDFRYIFCNNESLSLFGTTKEKTIHDIMDPTTAERIRKTDLEVFNTDIPYLGVEHIVLKDGRSYDTIVRKTVIEEDGKRMLLSIRWDQSMQNELQRRSKLLSLTMEAMNAFTWFFEPKYKRINFGDGIDNVGRKSSDINTLDSYLAIIHPDDVEPFAESLKSILEQESGMWNQEYRMDMNGDGQYTWWQSRGLVETTIQNDVACKYLFGMTISIDSHKQTEMTLLRNKENLNKLIQQNELILNNTNSGLAYINTDYVVQWENISSCSQSISFEAYKKGEQCYKSAHNRTSPCEDCVLQRTLKSHQMERIQFTLRDNRNIEIFATPVFDANNEIEGIVIRLDDITDREKIYHELREAKIRAEQSDKLKSAFLANMSHEIRTPLNAIVGFSDLLTTTTNPEEQEEFMAIINNNNELLLKLINDILDLSKIDAGAIDFKYEKFDLSEYFDGIGLSMQQRITTPNVRLICQNPYSLCNVNLDKARVAQLITNFVTNAIKYTPKGFIEMGYKCTEEGIRVEVRDTGIGIPEEKKDSVFRRFAKLDDFAQGTGLGLSICKAIVESMGGSIGFESQYGEGSLFWFTLPCTPELGEETCSTTTQKETTFAHEKVSLSNASNSDFKSRKTILIAEDIASNYLLLSSILKQQYNLLHAQNGEQAVNMTKTSPVDLVLMDMKMPVMDGLTATVEIRKFNNQLPIIALTAHAFESDRVASLTAGCNDYLVKPINKQQLISVLDKYMGAMEKNK